MSLTMSTVAVFAAAVAGWVKDVAARLANKKIAEGMREGFIPENMTENGS
jgi:hypothetical protein